MIDLIDRQEAIKALCKAGCDSGHCGVSCDDVKAIEDLPSADIDLSGFSDKLWETAYERGKAEAVRCEDCVNFSKTRLLIPQSAEVVRCKDCKHSYETFAGLICSHGVCVDCVVRDDFYCSYGERNNDGFN